MFKFLLKQFIQRTGRKPNSLEMLQLKFKAAEQAGKGKVIEFPRDKIPDWTKPRPTIGKGEVTDIGKKAQTAKTTDEDKFVAEFMANADRVYYRFVNDTLVKIQKADKNEQLQIAKDIINRKGMYRNLDEQDAAKILKSIDQNIKPVEPLAGGGIAGMLGEPTYQDEEHRVPYKDAGFTGSPVYFQDKHGEYDFSTRYNMMSPKEGWDQMIQDYINSTKMEEGELGKLPPIPLSALRAGLGFILKQLAGGKFKQGRRDVLKFFTKPGKSTDLTNKILYKKVKKRSDDLSKKIAEEMSKYSTKHAEGGRVPYQGGLKVYPKIKGSKKEIGLGDGSSQTLQDLFYGGTIMGEKDGLYGGIEGLKIKNKIDFLQDNKTLFKDTTDDEIINFIFGKKGKYGDIRIKTDKDFDNKQITWNMTFNEGGRVPFNKGKKVWDLLSLVRSKFGPKSVTTADKIKRSKKSLDIESTKAAFDRFNNKVATQEALAKGSEKMAGPIKHTKTGPFDFLESSDATTWLKQEKFFDPKALDIYGNKVPANWIAKEKKDAQKLIDDLGPLNVSPNHPNYKDMKAIRQSAKDRLESIKVTEALGGNIKMHDWLRMNRKNIKMSDYIRKADAPVVKDELSGIKKAFVQEKSSPWFKDPKILTPEDELRKEFPGISDDLINKILTDNNPQRIAEVKATLHEAMKMQEKGMPVEEIINIFKKKPTKHASGGLAGMLGE